MERGFDEDHLLIDCRMNDGSHHSGPGNLEHQEQTAPDSPFSGFTDYNDPGVLDKNNQDWCEQNRFSNILDPPPTESGNASPQVPVDPAVFSTSLTRQGFEGQFDTDWRIHFGHEAPREKTIFGSGKLTPMPECDRHKESTQSIVTPEPVDLIQHRQLGAGSSELHSETKEVPEITTLKVPSPASLDSHDQGILTGRVSAGNERPTSLADRVAQAREVDIGTVSGTPIVSTDDNESNEVEGDRVQSDLVLACPVCGVDIQIRSGDTFNYKRHMAKHGKEAGGPCPICHRVIARKDNIAAHIKDKHKIVGRCPNYTNCRTEFRGRCKVSQMMHHLAEPNEGDPISLCLQAARIRCNAEPHA